ncbi:D-alanine--D-alanine ligase family protein [Corynebacterium renale]|uniref:D-alanine--D-alanine ligase family protein n=1 Tax=Corynebacterium renale TaxID=1724 RepID=UPI000653978A|nr:D-alanine--D-alanine ligase family protein [Corynebacterium renale]
MNAPIRVGVVYGGHSPEHSISCISATSIMAALEEDPEHNYQVIPIGITPDGVWVEGTADPQGDAQLPTVPITREVSLSVNPQRAGHITFEDGSLYATVDVIFPVLHGPFGEDGTIQGLCELSGVPYVGPGVLASACGMDKQFTKKLAAAAGIPITREVVLEPGMLLDAEAQDYLGLPVFVKPARGGSSIGISRVTSWEEFPAALELAREHDPKVVVEAEIVGHEVEVGVLQYPDGSVVASVPAQLDGTGDSEGGFYDFDTKYVDNVVTAAIPAPVGEEMTQQLQELAITTFHALGCEGLSRVDFFVTETGPVFNEINTMPGFTRISMYPQMFAASGVDYPTLVSTMVQTALVESSSQ